VFELTGARSVGAEAAESTTLAYPYDEQELVRLEADHGAKRPASRWTPAPALFTRNCSMGFEPLGVSRGVPAAKQGAVRPRHSQTATRRLQTRSKQVRPVIPASVSPVGSGTAVP
jgi:hypothetical protein